jgi:hypothetical protein
MQNKVYHVKFILVILVVQIHILILHETKNIYPLVSRGVSICIDYETGTLRLFGIRYAVYNCSELQAISICGFVNKTSSIKVSNCHYVLEWATSRNFVALFDMIIYPCVGNSCR